MAGGQKINDHSAWCGKGMGVSVLPMGVHNKEYSSAEGAGEVTMYEDTSETIKGQQDMAKAKIKSHPAKPGYI